MTKRFNLILDDTTTTKIEELAEKYCTLNTEGKMNFTNTIRAIVGRQHAKEFPEYVIARKNALTPEERALSRIKAQEIVDTNKEEKAQSRLEGICLMMDEATLVNHPDTDRPACRYPVFTTASPHLVDKTWYTEELSLLNDETPSLQYHGLFNETGEAGKQDVLKRIKEKKIKFTD